MKVLPQVELEEFQTYYNGLEHCCLKPESKKLVSAATRVIHFIESVPDEENGAAVVAVFYEQYAVFQEWQDYTGHG